MTRRNSSAWMWGEAVDLLEQAERLQRQYFRLFSVDVAFELGQKFGVWSSSLTPSCFGGISLLENTVNYFMLGTFDFMDLTAIVVGSLTAYFTMVCSLERKVLSSLKREATS